MLPANVDMLLADVDMLPANVDTLLADVDMLPADVDVFFLSSRSIATSTLSSSAYQTST
ncbi:hypothetical protein [Polyangium sp. 15x6]|uniref:hypothetical protein n=1 Tax=Polyangium sp. 15x6 TaxID=3042687 RepID=UPI00249A4706|nr:hypothetical protein [Polyangium sp. 15x6]MDI3287334.1 hypothetical protein [Polyangium sp. 15x6]